MRTTAIIALAGVGLGLAGSPAQAGPCSLEIEQLTQIISTPGTDLPNSTSPGTTPQGAMPKSPTTAGTAPANPLDVQASKTVGAGSIPKAPSTSGSLPANPLEGTSQAGATVSTTPDSGDAESALEHARALDMAGDETSCMSEVAKVKSLLGIQ